MQLVIKTTRDRVRRFETRLRALHPYELPEFLVLDAGRRATAYLGWVSGADGRARWRMKSR